MTVAPSVYPARFLEEHLAQASPDLLWDQDSRHGAKVRTGSGAGFDLVAQDEISAGVAGFGGCEVFTQLGDRLGRAAGW